MSQPAMPVEPRTGIADHVHRRPHDYADHEECHKGSIGLAVFLACRIVAFVSVIAGAIA